MKHIQQLHALLTILLADNFPSRSLEDNKRTMLELKQFQSITYDKKQQYGPGSGNYRPILIENEVIEAENKLAQTIYDQMQLIDIKGLTPDQLMELHADYETYCQHRKINYSGKVDKANSEVRYQILIKAKKLEDRDEKIKLLNFITFRSNGEEYMRAKKLLDKMGYDEEDAHIAEFGERPK